MSDYKIFEKLIANKSSNIKDDLVKLKINDNECCGAKMIDDKRMNKLFDETMLNFINNKESELTNHLYSTQLKNKYSILTPEYTYFFMQKFALPDDTKIAVVGDLHGGLLNLLNFIIQLIDTNDFFINQNSLILKPNRYILSLGDLVDRGSRSREVVWFLCNLYNHIHHFI